MKSTNVIAHPAKQMGNQQRKKVALKAISNETTVTDIAKQHEVSRQFVTRQKNKAVAAVDQAFDEAHTDENKVLFYLPITKAWIEQLVLCLMLHGRASFRGITHVLKDVFDYDISVPSIHNISVGAKRTAAHINIQQDLSCVKLAAYDEIFHLNKPVLAGVDIPSLYCFLLSQEDHRDRDTWAVHFMDLQQQKLNPERAIGDDGAGLRAAHKTVFPLKPFDYDNFHLSKLLMDTRRYFRNRHKTSISLLIEEECKMEKAKKKGDPNRCSRKLGEAIKYEETMLHISKTIDTLVSWMEHDVLNKAGPPPGERKYLYDFIVDEFEKLAKIHPDRIKALCTTLRGKRDLVLAFCDVLDDKFQTLSDELGCSLDVAWEMCKLLRYNIKGDTYAIRSMPLQQLLGDKYDDVEDAVIIALNSTERTSSMIENLNSRLRGYFSLRQEIGHGYLDLLRFFLNHKPFDRSSNPNREGKSPAEILSGNSHAHWLEILGYTRFKRAA